MTIFQLTSEAVRQSQELTFDYKKLDSTKYDRRTLKPYHLACVQDQWYVIGHCLKRDALRTFVLARMKNASLGSVTFERHANFSIEKHLKDSFGVFSAKGTHTELSMRMMGVMICGLGIPSNRSSQRHRPRFRHYL